MMHAEMVTAADRIGRPSSEALLIPSCVNGQGRCATHDHKHATYRIESDGYAVETLDGIG